MNRVWQNVSVTTSRGYQLTGLLIHMGTSMQGGAHLTNAVPPEAVLIVVCHGFTGSKEGGGQALKMGEILAKMGYSVILFDFAGCGESGGEWEEITLTRQVEDLSDVVRWCRSLGYQNIVLNGRSFGGATALCYASRDVEIKGVCTWAAPADLSSLFLGFIGGRVSGSSDERVPLQGEGETIYLRKEFFYDLEKHNLLQAAASLMPRPLLIIHGTEDETVPVDDCRALYGSAGEPKALLLVEGADHRFSGHQELVWQQLFQWLNNYFPV